MSLSEITQLTENLQYFQTKIEQQGYTAYPLVSDSIENKWSVAILDINDAPIHFHKIETEHFIVLNGELEITMNDIHQILNVGQSMIIPPGIVHHLKSTSTTPVRVLCINFPAFDPDDFYLISHS